MLQTLGISLLVGIFGYLFIFVFVDGVLQAPFADSMVHFFEKFGFDNESAIHLYRAIFWDNKTMIISTGFIFLFLCSFYLGMSRFTTYLRQIESGIDMILTDSSDLIELEPELQPMENLTLLKLGIIKEPILFLATPFMAKISTEIVNT